ncbi:MAG: isoleucine--tRNA ligase [Planctomycetia bacterium TMED53]|nr:MAG: isoleucine--tRNA ligase [Planctomycetia bacterium TMED53]
MSSTGDSQNQSFEFPEPLSSPDFPKIESEVRTFWDQQSIYQKSMDARAGAEKYVFFEGPPTANGMPHPGHALTRAMKDLFPRYQTMRGRLCERKAGWDTHGLPVEIEVCKDMGIHSKEEIEEYGIEPFVRRCQKSVFRYVQEWESLTRNIGFWVDLDEAYATYHKSYVESVWWALKRLFEAGKLYQGEKIVWWWAQGGTGLSAGEVGEGYRQVDDPSVFVKMPILDESGNPTKDAFVAWTTTPWTLPSNQFLAVHPEVKYARLRDETSDSHLIIAEDLVDSLADKWKREFEVLEVVSGSELIGQRYLPPFDGYYSQYGQASAELEDGGSEPLLWRVVAADFVTTDSGTGIVHQAPAFGEIDHEVLLSERSRFSDKGVIPLLCAVEANGTFNDAAGSAYSGRWVKDCDKEITRELKEKGLLVHQEMYRHDYPFCPRAPKDALIQYPRHSWFIRTTEFVDDMLANNQEITWLPEHIKEGRFGKYLESNVDWTLSRERFWGTPLPIWVCESTGNMEAIESYDELLSKPGVAGQEVFTKAKDAEPDLDENLKVHRPYIDAVTYDSPFADGARMKRVQDVIDCWFDAGCMPFAQWGYPHLGSGKFETQFPADFISEAIDQTRGWFYALLSISTILFGPKGAAHGDDRVSKEVFKDWPMPFKSCIVLGHLLGEDGAKMSKSLKNYKTPEYIFEKEGADAMRWLFYAGQAPWTSLRFQEQAITEGQREFLLRLWNVYSFFTIYARIDGWVPSGDLTGEPDESLQLSDLDRWVLAELNTTVGKMRSALDTHDNLTAATALNEFVDGLSNWYVRRGRDRYWSSGMNADKEAAQATLYHCLVTTSLLAAPFVPFITEHLYGALVSPRGSEWPESVHLCDYPEVNERFLDGEMCQRMALIREIASLGRACRSREKLRVRQPLPAVRIILADPALVPALEKDAELIAEELNVKNVEFVQDASEYVSYEVKPNFKAIGPRFGGSARHIAAALAAHPDPAALVEATNSGQVIDLVIEGGETVQLEGADLDIRIHQKEGWSAAEAKGVVVVLSTEVSPDLHREGLVREVTSHVQGIRRDLDLGYIQRIRLTVETEGELAVAVEEHSNHLKSETLAEELVLQGEGTGEIREFEIEGHSVKIGVEPL